MKGELPALCIDWRHLLVSTACRAVTAMEGGQGGVSAYAVFRWRIVCDCNCLGLWGTCPSLARARWTATD